MLKTLFTKCECYEVVGHVFMDKNNGEQDSVEETEKDKKDRRVIKKLPHIREQFSHKKYSISNFGKGVEVRIKNLICSGTIPKGSRQQVTS